MKPIQYPLFATAILCIVAYAIYRNWGWWRGPYSDGMDLWFGIFVIVFCTIIGEAGAMGAALGIDSYVASKAAQKWVVYGEWQMVSMRSTDGISGSVTGGIFMISGSVGSDTYYKFYYKEGGGGDAIIPGQWDAGSDTRIYQEDRSDGEMVEWRRAFVHPWVTWFATPSQRYRMDFHIPKGRLKEQFSIE